MGGVERLLVILASEEIKFLLNRPEPVIGTQRILSPRENRRLSSQEIREIISTSSSTPSMRSRVVHESLQKHLIILAVLLNLHEHLRHAWWWR